MVANFYQMFVIQYSERRNSFNACLNVRAFILFELAVECQIRRRCTEQGMYTLPRILNSKLCFFNMKYCSMVGPR